MNPEQPTTPPASVPQALPAGAALAQQVVDPTPAVIDSEQVLQGRAAVVIAHRGAYYRLQATRQGKLILTK